MADYPRAFVRLPPADIATERIVARTLTAIVSGRQVHAPVAEPLGALAGRHDSRYFLPPLRPFCRASRQE